MEEAVATALRTERLIDITTIGRRSGAPRRIEVWLFRTDGRFFLGGRPGPRAWFANVLAEPRFTLHLKGAVQADVPATATPLTDPQERRRIVLGIFADIEREYDDELVDAWVSDSPLAEISFDGA